MTSHAACAETQGPTVITATGRLVDPFDLRVKDISLRDIAHHLAMTCRFHGGVSTFYSVASHSLAVSRQAVNIARLDAAAVCAFDPPTEREALRLTGAYALLHDAGEAYLGDIRQPIKARDECEAIRRAEGRAVTSIFRAVGLPEDIPYFIAKAIQEADHSQQRREAYWLMPASDGWGKWGEAEMSAPIGTERLNPEDARADFLAEAKSLGIVEVGK